MKIKLCPKCKSTGLDFFAGGITGEYYCKKCGYRGPVIIERDIETFKKAYIRK